ncbi:MAG: Phasin protein [Rhodospirillales bacterium]|jgi:hypothetical protein|nr:Phasin protein [Rhodospirillales bacterium]
MQPKKLAPKANRSPAAARQAGTEVAEKTVTASRAVAKKTQAAAELAEEGAETIRRAAEQHGLQLHEATLATGKAGEELADRVQAGAATLAKSGEEVAGGLQDVGRVWAEFVQDGMRESIAATQSLLRARSFSEAMRIQSDYLRNSFELLLDTTAEISDLSKQMMSMTAHRMSSVTPEARAPGD